MYNTLLDQWDHNKDSSEDRELAGPDPGGAKDLCGEHHPPLQPVLQQSAGRRLQHACHGVWIRSEFVYA